MSSIEKIRHSVAHLLAASVLELWPGTKNTIGPVIKDGFYYDFDFKKPPSIEDLIKIENKMREILKTWDRFERIEVTASEAKKYFWGNPYKNELIDELKRKGKKITLYKSGNFIDLCRGGHVKRAREINPDAFKLTHIAGAYWRGSEKNKMLTRIYGLAFKNKKELDEYLKQMEEIEKRDHRKIGQKLELFSFNEVSPGAVFWHPKGLIIYKELEKFIIEENKKMNYQEISTPILVKKELWEKSGHWQNYKENMFYFDVDGEIFGLKPMNCPESTVIYSSKIRSYKDMPLRFSEPTGRLHRKEVSGALGGLFRLYQFTQDDAHIYCRPDQIEEEIDKLIKFAKKIHKMFKFESLFRLATKPDKAIGSAKLWKIAQNSLKNALVKNKIKYEIKPKDGTFYGPKIDINVKDSLKREWTVTTVQLDFQMPERFNLEYVDKDGRRKRPVIIHRAILGSFERFIGILLEHTFGNLPLWLAPVQAIILPVGKKYKNYAKKIYNQFIKENIRIEISEAGETISKRIREAEIQKIPYILVVGQKEEEQKNVSVRKRGERGIELFKIESLIKKMKEEIEAHQLKIFTK